MCKVCLFISFFTRLFHVQPKCPIWQKRHIFCLYHCHLHNVSKLTLHDAISCETSLQYNVRMLFPSIETGTAMNSRESENYLPISRSFSASKQCRDFLGRDISGTTLFQGRDISGTTFNINNRKQFQITAHSIFCRFNHVLVSGVSFPVHEI